MTRTGYLGVGSNLGDRRAHLEAAVAELPRHGIEVVASSSTYDTDPVGEIPDQPDFLNACLRIRTAHGPQELVRAGKAVECIVGREPDGVRHGPRSIDIDLLLLGDVTYESARLSLPHAGILSRRFVLVPLLELDPGLTLPDGTTLASALTALEAPEGVRQAGPALV